MFLSFDFISTQSFHFSKNILIDFIRMEVVKMIEEIRMEQSPLGEDYDESRNTLSPSLATTEDGLAGY